MVVVDTTAIFTDPHLRRTWPDLLEFASAEVVRVVVPEVVVREACRQQAVRAREARDGALREANRGLAALRELVDGVPELDVTAVRAALNQAGDKYENALRVDLLLSGVEIAPIPAVDHDLLVSRDLALRKPFNKTGKGYRDALIWHTLLTIARELDAADHVVFVTSNTGDFAEGGELAADLLADLDWEDAPAVTHETTIANALNSLAEEIDSFALELDQPGQWITIDHVLEIAAAPIRTALDRLMGISVADSLESSGGLDVPGGLESPTWYNVDLELDTAEWSLSSRRSEIAGEVRVIADITIDGYVDKYGVFDEDGASQFEVLDDDWNDHYAWVSVEQRSTLVFLVTLTEDGSDVEEVELIDVR